jgi:hypothetical protein
MAMVIPAHSQHEQTVDMSAAELEPYRAQREQDDAPKQAPRRGRSR